MRGEGCGSPQEGGAFLQGVASGSFGDKAVWSWGRQARGHFWPQEPWKQWCGSRDAWQMWGAPVRPGPKEGAGSKMRERRPQ